MTRPALVRSTWPLAACVALAGVGLAGAAAAVSSPEPSEASEATVAPGTGSGGTDDAPAVVTSEGVEVTTYGTVQVRGNQDAQGPLVTVAVHGVQRVEGGTVVYLSAGYDEPEGRVDPNVLDEDISTQIGARYTGGAQLTGVRVVDPVAGAVLSAQLDPRPGAVPSALGSPVQAFPREPGTMAALYVVLPELDAATETVDVQVAYGLVVPDVPVGEGLLTPVAPVDEVVPLGSAWPDVDLDVIADAVEPELSVHPLTAVSRTLDESLVTSDTGEQVQIDVAADVLFAFDSADLSPQARATLEQVGADVVERATGTELLVVGHTDDRASDAYNDDLSRRRAEAAASVLAPFAAEAGLSVRTEGRGEREPVADNATDEGRQANRRVTVTFDTDGQEQP